MRIGRKSASLTMWMVCGVGWAQSPPVITQVANAEGEHATIAPNTWVEVKGLNRIPRTTTRCPKGRPERDSRCLNRASGQYCSLNKQFHDILF